MPKKRLIHGSLTDDEGGLCAIACYAKHKGVDLSNFDPEDESVDVGVAAGMPSLVAWNVVALTDVELETVWEVATYKGGIPLVRDMTTEERYEKVLAWVRVQLDAPQRLAESGRAES